mmetsp:Transcript_26130/g.63481  ORF Transcript_26130/g.63481 Transcript_26130/m.63481 type:complete len:117 (-) Transcript_26130:780-1130(-)
MTEGILGGAPEQKKKETKKKNEGRSTTGGVLVFPQRIDKRGTSMDSVLVEHPFVDGILEATQWKTAAYLRRIDREDRVGCSSLGMGENARLGTSRGDGTPFARLDRRVGGQGFRQP